MNTSAAGKSFHRNSISDRFSNRNLAECLSMSLLAAALLGCTGPAIQGVSVVDTAGNTIVAAGTRGAVSRFALTGTGVCGRVQLDFGDGTLPAQIDNYDFANAPVFTHTYTGWAGRKTVKAGSLQNCVGTPEITFTVRPVTYAVGYVPTLADACGPVPNRPIVRKNSKVHITALPGPMTAEGTPGPPTKINFGCPLNACIYDEDGMAGQAPAEYPYPGFRPFSLVLRIGTDYYQGGTNATFTAGQTGTLEMCRNEGNNANHGGGWGINIDVDETGAQ